MNIRFSTTEIYKISTLEMAILQQSETNDEKYISLKEAARISGYAPDYVGQLIRKGKIAGKRVFLNEAWVTTETEIRKYIENEKSGSAPTLNRLRANLEAGYYEKIIKIVLRCVLAASFVLLAFLLYAFASNIDKKLSDRALQSVEQENAASYGNAAR